MSEARKSSASGHRWVRAGTHIGHGLICANRCGTTWMPHEHEPRHKCKPGPDRTISA